MSSKKIFLVIFLLPILSISQKKDKSNEVSKVINNKNAIYSNISNEQIVSAIKTKAYLSRVFVFYENKFYSVDTLKQIKNLSDYKMDIIEFPDKITKDIEKLVILRKAVK
jgi:hypothetical protein